MKKITLLITTFLLILTGCADMRADKKTGIVPTETTDAGASKEVPQETIAEPDEEPSDLFEALDGLEYQPYTCDGLPEYRLTAENGTVYAVNLSEKWVWRGDSAQAELPDELAARLKEYPNLIAAEEIVETP